MKAVAAVLVGAVLVGGCATADPVAAPAAVVTEVVTERVAVPVQPPVQRPPGYEQPNVPAAPRAQPQQRPTIVTVPHLDEPQQGIDLGIDDDQAALQRQQAELERQQEWQQQEMERQQRALEAQLEEQQEQLECMQSDLEGGFGC